MAIATGRDERMRQALGLSRRRPDIRTLYARFITQWRVIRALMIRDMMSRYGRENIGFLWLIGEPVLLIGGIIVLWSIMKGSSTHGISVVTYALTGYSMLTLWRHLAGHGKSLLRGNTGLLFHQNVRVIDTIIAHVLMESIGTFISFLFCYTLLYLLGYIETVYDPLLMVIAWVLMTLFGAGFSMVLGALCEYSRPIERMVPPLMYFSLPVTGAFTLVAWLPDQAREIILLFPMAHCFEMFRAGFIGPRLTFYYDTGYLLFWVVVFCSAGLVMVKQAERHMHVG